MEELMRLCQLQDDDKKMAIWLMEDLTKVRKMTQKAPNPTAE